MSGFSEPILHGLCSMGISARAVLRRFGGAAPAAAFRAIKVRFSKPVLPGQVSSVYFMYRYILCANPAHNLTRPPHIYLTDAPRRDVEN